MKKMNWVAVLLVWMGAATFAHGQTHDATLHVNPKWKECSFQLDPSLTQEAWHQFAAEAAMVAYFRPVKDAKPLGAKNFEVSILQWATAFNDNDEAWNNTFVHPDSEHWLKEGSRLKFPGITARVGITDKMDVGVYWTKSFGANYGFWGAQLQYNLLNFDEKKWAVSARASYTSMYGPEDLNLSVAGVDFVASKEFRIYSDWASVAPYVGVSSSASRAIEKTDKVTLENEHIFDGQAMAGAVIKLAKVQLGVEYNLARVNTVSYKIGMVF